MFGLFGGRGIMLRSVTVLVAIMGLGVTTAQAQLLRSILDSVGESASTASEATTINVINSPFTPSSAGLSYDTPADTCGLSPWSRAYGESTSLALGPINSTIVFGTGVLGLDLACSNVGGNNVNLTGGIYGGGSRGRIDTQQYPDVDFDIEQWMVGVYGSISVDNFAANLKVQYDDADFVGRGFASAGLPIADGTGLFTRRLNVSGAASYAFEILDNVFVTPVVGFDVSSISADRIDFGNGISFEPNSGTSSIVYVGLSLANTIVLPDGTSAIVPFVSGTYYHDLGGGLSGTLIAGPDSGPLDFTGSGNYGEVGAGINYLNILDDGLGGGGPKQMTAGIRGLAKFNNNMTGYGGAATVRVQF